jgi:uncharacterized repeat protein (TIGR01451 family)
MKRWLIRLGALSTVVLSGLLYYAYASKGPAKAASAVNAVEDSAATVKPIPLIADDAPASNASQASDPFAARSKLIDAVEPTATGDRYATVGYREQPAETAPTVAEEPSPLPSDVRATEMPAPRNPFRAEARGDEPYDRYADTAAANEPANAMERSTAPVESSDGQRERASSKNPPAEEPAARRIAEESLALVPVGRPSQPTETAALDRDPPSSGESPFGSTVEDPADTSAFDQPAARDVARPSSIGGTGKPGNRTLEGPQAPSLTIEKSAPPEISVGKPATFVIHVRNVGKATANDVEVHDELPHGTQLVATKPAAIESQGNLVWQLGALKPGDEATVEMQITPTSEGELGSVASVTFRAEASARTKATRPQLKLDVVAPSKVLIGETAPLRIRLSNPGSGAATGVVLTEEVPSGLKHEGGRELEFEVGTLAPGESRELELSLAAAQPGIATNVLRAVGEGNLEVEDRDDIEVIAPALKLALKGPSRRYLQRNATYEISVHNPGTAAAKNIELSVTLPRGLQFVEANNQGQYDATGHRVAWSLEELPPGETGTVSLTMLAAEPGDLRLLVNGKAAMGLSDSMEEEISVEGVAAIFFELVDAQDPIEVGGETLYEIRVINQGSAPATNVRLAALLPPEMKAIDADGPSQHTLEPNRVLFEPLSQLAPKADTMYTVKVRGESPGDQRIRVQIVTDEIKQPVTKEESTRVYADE